jgi:hypothetical protein
MQQEKNNEAKAKQAGYRAAKNNISRADRKAAE